MKVIRHYPNALLNMQGQTEGEIEWNDPYEIIESDAEPRLSEEQRRAVLEAIIAEYENEHTTTRLDANASFRLEDLTPVDDDPVTECEFEVQRFVNGTPAKRYTGYVNRTDTEWNATYETQPWSEELLNTIRNLLPHTSTE